MTKRKDVALDLEDAISEQEQAFYFSERRTRLALEAVKLDVISTEEAGVVVRAFLATPAAT